MPLFLAAVGIIFRGAAFALRGEAATIAEARAAGRAPSRSRSVLIPFFLGAAIGAVASGQVPVGGAGRRDLELDRARPSLLAGVLAVARGRVPGGDLPGGRRRPGGPRRTSSRPSAARARRRRRRRRARASAGSPSSTRTRPTSTTGSPRALGLALVIGSAVAGRGDARRSSGPGASSSARYSAAAAVGAILVGWRLASGPTSCPGALTFDEAAAGDATLIATLIASRSALA